MDQLIRLTRALERDALIKSRGNVLERDRFQIGRQYGIAHALMRFEKNSFQHVGHRHFCPGRLGTIIAEVPRQ